MDSIPSQTDINRKLDISNPWVWQGFIKEPIPFDKGMAILLQIEIERAFASQDPLTYIFPKPIIDYFGNESKRFLVALLAYFDSPNPVLSRKELLDGILIYDFATYLKKLRSHSLIVSSSAVHDEDPGEDFVNIPGRLIRDIGDIFNYRYWINWIELPKGDIDFHHIPVNYDQDHLDAFESAVIELVSEVYQKGPVPVIKPEEVLLDISSSSCIDNGKRTKVWKAKSANLKFSTKPLKGYLTMVQKGPTEVRECVTLTIPQSNSVRLLEKQIYHIVKNMRYSAYHADSEVFEKRFDRFTYDNFRFFNRDLTKEGITKPRKLIKIIFDVLKEIDPFNPNWKYGSIYEDFSYVDENNIEHQTERGHGLGMANALTTLMQCAAFQACKDMHTISNVEALFYNDDATIGSVEPDDLDTFRDIEPDFLRNLGLLPKGTKTWAGNTSILCERYHPENFDRKISMKNYARFLPFSATNILCAKNLSALCIDPTYGEPRWDLFNKLVQFFGLESGDQDEITTPISCGGWLSFKVGGVDLSFLDQPETPPTIISNGSYIGAPNIKPKHFERPGGEWVHPITKLYDIPVFPKVIEDRWFIGKDSKEVSAYFSKSSNRLIIEKWLQDEERRRKDQWRIKYPYRSWEEIITTVSLSSNNDVLPPRSYIRTKEQEAVSVVGEWRVDLPNPISSLIEFYSPDGGTGSRCAIPWPTRGGSTLESKENRKISKDDNTYRELGKFRGIVFDGIYLEDRILTNRCWKKPYDVWRVWVALHGQQDYPINPWPVGEAKLNQDYEKYESYIERFWPLFKLTDEIPFTKIKEYTSNIYNIADVLDEEPPDVFEIKEAPPLSNDVVPSFNDWFWVEGKKPFAPESIYAAYLDAEKWLRSGRFIRTLLGQRATVEEIGESGDGLCIDKAYAKVLKNLCHLDLESLSDKVHILSWRSTEVELEEGEDPFGGIFG